MNRKQICCVLFTFVVAGNVPAMAQSHALPSGDVQAIYQRLLDKIALRQYDVFTGNEKVSLTVREKLGILAKGFLKRLS